MALRYTGLFVPGNYSGLYDPGRYCGLKDEIIEKPPVKPSLFRRIMRLARRRLQSLRRAEQKPA